MTDNQIKPTTYDIGELEEATGLPRRTIHYYIKEGLIAGPEGSGRNARYGTEHVVRLKLIKQLRETSHWRLEGIREFLDGLTLQAAADLVGAPADLVDRNVKDSGDRRSISDTWERVRISDEIEIHYKQSPDGGMDASRKIRSLLAFARKLFRK